MFKALLCAGSTALALTALLATPAAAAPNKCSWEGTAPMCNARCPSGFKVMKRDKKGDGKKCVTGTKVFCCPANITTIRGKAPMCNGKCKPGEINAGTTNKTADGKTCTTGKAAICLKPVKAR